MVAQNVVALDALHVLSVLALSSRFDGLCCGKFLQHLIGSFSTRSVESF